MEGYLAEVRLFAGNFPPRGWAFCNGATMSIADYTALFALIGTIYGGNGQTTFRLPDLQGRVPVGTGTGPGLPAIVLGQAAGTETVTMTVNQMPTHTHVTASSVTIPSYNAAGESGSPTNTVLAGLTTAYSTQTADTSLKAETPTLSLAAIGMTNPFSIIQPYLTTNYIICIEGIFPSRN